MVAKLGCAIEHQRVATADEMIHGPGVFKAEFARHAGRFCRKKAGCQLRNVIYGLTPFSFSFWVSSR